MGSSRFPGKPLANILGKSMIEHCYVRTSFVKMIDHVCVATCDNTILTEVKAFGGNAILTANNHARATTRSAEALEKLEKKFGYRFDVIVMVQGDEPLISPESISRVIKSFDDSQVKIANIMSPILCDDDFEDINNVKVVCDDKSDAMYFSRQPIPHNWSGAEKRRFLQTGIIAFRRDALIEFNMMNESFLERTESVDMNRLLENGIKVKMIATDYPTLGVDVPSDIEKAEKIMLQDTVFDLYKNL